MQRLDTCGASGLLLDHCRASIHTATASDAEAYQAVSRAVPPSINAACRQSNGNLQAKVGTATS